MIRPITIITAVMACGSGLFLYQAKHDAQVLDKKIERTVHDTSALREQSRLLAAEWTMLNDPERLRQFSDTYLALKPIAPTQFTSLADLDGRLPAPRQAPPASADIAPVEPDPAPAEAPVATVTAPAPDTDDARSAPKPPDHRSLGGKPAGAETQAPRALVAVEPHPIPAGDQRPIASSDQRPIASGDQHLAAAVDPHPADQRAAHAQADIRPTQESRPMQENRPVHDVRLVQAVRPAQDIRPGQEIRPAQDFHPAQVARSVDVRPQPRPQQAGAPPLQSDAYNGSLLGMARGSAPAPAPRPTPVNATNWYNAN